MKGILYDVAGVLSIGLFIASMIIILAAAGYQ